MDTGNIRHWPRISREQLVKLFPDGRTVHIPSDGHPLPGYALALADVERDGHAPSRVSLASARDAGAIDSAELSAAEETPRAGGHKNFLASLFGFGGSDDKQIDKKPRASRPVAVAHVTAPARVATERIVPLPKDKPVALAALTVQPATQSTVVASNWPAAVEQGPERVTPEGRPLEVADADPVSTAALAYANDTLRPAAAPKQVAPMGAALPRMRPAAAMPRPVAEGNAAQTATLIGGGERNDVWMRATLLAPNTREYLTSAPIGNSDKTQLATFMHKPASVVTMEFAALSHDDMVSERFSGPAVVFIATTTFTRRYTAALR
jgi:hypothetical protein